MRTEPEQFVRQNVEEVKLDSSKWSFICCIFYYLLEDYKKALDLYDKAIKINPKDAAAWHNKGVSLDKVGRRDEAQNCFDKAKELGSNI